MTCRSGETIKLRSVQDVVSVNPTRNGPCDAQNVRVYISSFSSLNPHHCCCSIMSTWLNRGPMGKMDSSFLSISAISFTERGHMIFLFTSNQYSNILAPADRRTNPSFVSIIVFSNRVERGLRCSSRELHQLKQNCSESKHFFHRCLFEGGTKARGMCSRISLLQVLIMLQLLKAMPTKVWCVCVG